MEEEKGGGWRRRVPYGVINSGVDKATETGSALVRMLVAGSV